MDSSSLLLRSCIYFGLRLRDIIFVSPEQEGEGLFLLTLLLLLFCFAAQFPMLRPLRLDGIRDLGPQGESLYVGVEEVLFLSPPIHPGFSRQGTTKDLWATRVSPRAETPVG